jgi:hypothetical protein
MSRGEQLWQAAETGTKTGDLKSQHVLRMYALAQMLAGSETALLKDDLQAAAASLRELQRYASMLQELLDNASQNAPDRIAA